MLVNEIMTPTVHLVSPETTLREAAVALRDQNVGALPVGDNDRLVGMVTDRDIAIRGVAGGMDPTIDRVAAVMTEQVLYCFDDQPVEDARTYMKGQQVRRLPVINRQKRLVGILALGDMATESETIRPAAEALAGVSRQA